MGRGRREVNVRHGVDVARSRLWQFDRRRRQDMEHGGMSGNRTYVEIGGNAVDLGTARYQASMLTIHRACAAHGHWRLDRSHR